MATQQDEIRKKWTLKNVFFSTPRPEFWTFETSSWIPISNRFFWSERIYWDINFVLKCLPDQCATYPSISIGGSWGAGCDCQEGRLSLDPCLKTVPVRQKNVPHSSCKPWLTGMCRGTPHRGTYPQCCGPPLHRQHLLPGRYELCGRFRHHAWGELNCWLQHQDQFPQRAEERRGRYNNCHDGKLTVFKIV